MICVERAISSVIWASSAVRHEVVAVTVSNELLQEIARAARRLEERQMLCGDYYEEAMGS